jgi:ribonuclease D
MSIITDTETLADFCRRVGRSSYVTVDTEFMRENTFWPHLCVVQVAGEDDAAVIDALADGMDLTPLYALMADPAVLKVFHAARQDLEIFYNLLGKVPHPIFDTQVAAMVCGYGEQIGYLNLVSDICNHKPDKGAQFTDWSRRPLSKSQIAYAIDDVVYLRNVYEKLRNELESRGRIQWVKEEMAILADPATYQNPPDEAWERIKIKSHKPSVYAVLKEISAWREVQAQRRNVPRNRVVRDETLADMAIHPPKSAEELAKIRGIGEDFARGRHGEDLLAAVRRGLDCPKGETQMPDRKPPLPQELAPVLEMLKMLLRIEASANEVATKLIASSDDLEQLAKDDNADIPAMKGWRHEIFGKEAVGLKQGKLALSLKDGRITKTYI